MAEILRTTVDTSNKINIQIETNTNQGGLLLPMFLSQKIIASCTITSELIFFLSFMYTDTFFKYWFVWHSEKESNFDGYGKPSIPANGVPTSPNIFVAENTNEMRELRQLTPPLPFPVRNPQVRLTLSL